MRPLTHCKAGITVKGLVNFRALVQNNPQRIHLGFTLRIQSNRLICSEIRFVDLLVVRTNIEPVHHSIAIPVFVTNVSFSVTCTKLL